MTIDTNPIADGNAAMANANAANPAENTHTTNATSATTLLNGTGLPAEGSPNPTPTRLIDDSGAFTEGWLDRLPPEFNDSKQILGQFKDALGMAKTLVSQQRLLGKKTEAVLLPGDKSPPEEWTDFHRRLGVPESPEPYKTARPSTLPEGTEWNDQIAAKTGEIAHQAGITPKQWQAVLNSFGEMEAQSQAAEEQKHAQERQESLKQLTQEWGEKFDVNMSKATRLVQLGGGDINDIGLASPGMVKMLARIADTLSDDKMVTSDLSATMMVGKARAMDIMRNPDNPMHKRYQSGDREVANLVTDLLKA
jgi:hypothetical protein